MSATRVRLVLVLVVILIVGVGAALLIRARSADPRPILLEGTIVTPERVIPDGWILVEHGRISQVSDTKPAAPQAVEVNTGGIIFPGLIDLHNHLSYDVFPYWQPVHHFLDRYEWRSDPDYLRLIGNPYNELVTTQKLFCDMNTYGELRALAGGTTAMLATAQTGCIQGLVRNLDYSSSFYNFLDADTRHLRNDIELRASTSPATVRAVQAFLADDRSEAFVVHLAEGVDAAALDEFTFLQQQGLLTRKTVLIHGLALGPAQFQAMQAAGASLVWSPRSNLDLYGATADIQAALDAGMRVALAPDWSVSGSSSLLDELHFAAQWNTDHLGGRLSDEQLVAMATTLPAQMAGIDDQVGVIRAGLWADLLVISGDRQNPYHALLQAQPADVQWVLIGGQPLYGAPDLMASVWQPAELNTLDVAGVTKMVRLPDGVTVSALESKLQAALAAQGTTLGR